MSVKCLAKEHNTMSPARTQTRTALVPEKTARQFTLTVLVSTKMCEFNAGGNPAMD